MWICILVIFAIIAIKENHCAIAQNGGPEVKGQVSGMIAPYGVCSLWVPNEQETR
jgi:hypothetical protein